MSAIQLPFAYFLTLLKDDIRVERLDRVEPFPELSEHDEISILDDDDLRTVCACRKVETERKMETCLIREI